ncbi:type VII secretion target [Microbacterium sp. SORGH_AS_0888]|uniref:type VII secretion target n=1 Tax=Microbacterium sp. SORGH_AS_0888 TaxID=3041791 RepID=UPI0027862E32|nr:type VII secretion target [Microbacterium sp. SORGH_AS_0888]MDQ1129558.1 hypothetical protein [Microbacterium sp. SORGH_AS_0888]
MTDLDVQVNALRAHASKLGDAADRVGQAAEASLTAVALQPAAFGLLCSFLVPIVSLQQSTTLAGLGALRVALAAESAAVSGAALTYSALDDGLADAIAKVI